MRWEDIRREWLADPEGREGRRAVLNGSRIEPIAA